MSGNHNGVNEWHIFVILIVSCISTLVAPNNLSVIASIGVEVYNSPLNFKKIVYTYHEMWHFKIMVFPLGTGLLCLLFYLLCYAAVLIKFTYYAQSNAQGLEF